MKIKIELTNRGFYFSRRQVIIFFSEMSDGDVVNLQPYLFGEKYKKFCCRMKLKYNGKDVGR